LSPKKKSNLADKHIIAAAGPVVIAILVRGAATSLDILKPCTNTLHASEALTMCHVWSFKKAMPMSAGPAAVAWHQKTKSVSLMYFRSEADDSHGCLRSRRRVVGSACCRPKKTKNFMAM